MGGFGGLDDGLGAATSARREPKVPVSIVCGFLGAGKTTMVQHILSNREGLKVGVVVNDVAEANIDSEVLTFSDADGMVALQNGCVCCSGRDDLFFQLRALADSSGISKLDKGWDRLVVECSGVAEPESIASELRDMADRGEPLMDRVFLAGIVCLVDATTFWDVYHSAEGGSTDPDGREVMPLSALLLSQLESADTVVLNKADLVSEAELRRLRELVKALSPSAQVLTSTRGALPLRTLLPAEPTEIDMPAYVPSLANRHGVAVRAAAARGAAAAAAARSAGGDAAAGRGHADGGAHDADCGHDGHAHGHGHDGHAHVHSHGDGEDCTVCAHTEAASRHEKYGLGSFVYRSKALFDASKLAALARSLPVAAAEIGLPAAPLADAAPAATSLGDITGPFAGVLRSKGFVRVKESQTGAAYYWSHAGRRLELGPAPGAPPCKGQELVFIGAGMDQAAIEGALDGCLTSE